MVRRDAALPKGAEWPEDFAELEIIGRLLVGPLPHQIGGTDGQGGLETPEQPQKLKSSRR